MREKIVTDSAPCISLFVVTLLLISLVPFSSSSLLRAQTNPPTAISPTDGTGSPASLGTVITSGTSTVPTQLCSASCVITGGTRAGDNLFHSFGDFSVGALDSARFQTGLVNPLPDASVSIILGRVTGGNPSNIFGTLNSATYYPSANLFLMNPAGFLFGPNATVNVGGMMTFTTADYMRLTDSGRFNANPNPNATPLDMLTAAPVAAFGFLGSSPAAINFEGGLLTVAEGTGLALVGGDINLTPDSSGTPSGITTLGRPIQLTSVAGPGEVAADTGIPATGMALGTVTLDQGATLSTVGDLAFGDGSGGAVSIRGGQFVASDSFIQTAPVAFSGAGSAGALFVTANDSLTMTNTFIDASSLGAGGDGGPVTLRTNGLLSLTDSFIGTGAYETSAPGNGGAVTIMGKNVTFNNSGVATDVIVSSDVTNTPALGQVRPGSVTITAQDTVTFSGSLFGDPSIPVINATAFGTQLDAGSVTITGKTVNLSNGSIIADMNRGPIPSPGNGGAIEIRGNNVNLSGFTLRSVNAGLVESTGKAGSILIRGADNSRADSIQLTASNIDTSSVSGGGGGPIEFQAKALRMSDGSVVHTNSFARGAGGTITVRGAENITVESGSHVFTNNVGNLIAQNSFGTAGDILFETQNLAVLSGGQISAIAQLLSTGNAGNIMVQGNSNNPAQSILIDGPGSGIFTETQGTGAGGNIFVNANSVAMTNGASVSASSTGPGNAGNIQINAGNQFAMTNSTVTTEADAAGGGTIKITTTPSGTVQLTNSLISASVLDGAGGGGSVDIDPLYVLLQNSQILAQAVQGPGGNITITITNGGLFLPDANSTISASSQFGVNGTVTIQSPNAPASGQIQPLGKSPLIATSLLNQHCASLAGGEFSSFTVAGRDSLPTEPGNWLASPLATLNAGVGLGAKAEGVKAEGVRPVVRGERLEGETALLSLRQIAPAGFLTQAFAVDWSASCQS